MSAGTCRHVTYASITRADWNAYTQKIWDFAKKSAGLDYKSYGGIVIAWPYMADAPWSGLGMIGCYGDYTCYTCALVHAFRV